MLNKDRVQVAERMSSTCQAGAFESLRQAGTNTSGKTLGTSTTPCLILVPVGIQHLNSFTYAWHLLYHE